MTFELLENATARVVANLAHQQDVLGKFHRYSIQMVKLRASQLDKMGPYERQVNLFHLLGLHPHARFPDLNRRIDSFIDAQVKASRANHWTFDPDRLIALRAHRLVRRTNRMREAAA